MWGTVSAVIDEVQSILELALPSILSNSLEGSLGIVDVMMLGHLGKGNVAALSMGNAFFNIAWYFIEGFLTAQDTLASHAHALNDPGSVRQWSYISLAAVTFLCAASSVMFVLAMPLLGSVFQLPFHLKTKAAVHVYLLLPGLWFLAFTRVMQKYLQAQGVMTPGLYAGLVGNAVNIAANYLFIFELQWGFAGCGLSTSIARLASMLVLFYTLKRRAEFGTIVAELRGLGRDPAVTRGCNTLVNSVRACCPQQYQFLAGADGGDDEGLQLVSVSKGKPGAAAGGQRGKKDTPHKKPWPSDGAVGGNKSGDANSSSSSSSSSSDSGDSSSDDSSDEGKGDARDHEDVSLDVAAGSGLVRGSERTTHTAGDEDGHVPPSVARRRRLLLLRSVRLVLLGIPGGFMLGLESWIFVAAGFFVAQMGSVPLATHEVMVAFSLFCFLALPFAISVASTIRVSHLLTGVGATTTAGGLTGPYQARLSTLCSLGLGVVAVAQPGLLVYFLPGLLGSVFTDDEDVLYRFQDVAPVLAAFQVVYGLQGVCQGILRGIGRQLEVAGFTLLCLWVVGLPTSIYTAFYARPTFGFPGFWYGLLLGFGMLLSVCVLLVLLIDWDKEGRRASFRADLSQRAGGGKGSANSVGNPMFSSSDGPDDNDDDDDDFDDGPGDTRAPQVGLPRPGSLAIGGFPLHVPSLKEELDELEHIEGTGGGRL